jgi:phage-related protein
MALSEDIAALGTRIAEEIKGRLLTTYFNAFNLYPVRRHNGTTWPTRNPPSGYTGPILFDSTLQPTVTTGPTDRATNDVWDRVSQ